MYSSSSGGASHPSDVEVCERLQHLGVEVIRVAIIDVVRGDVIPVSLLTKRNCFHCYVALKNAGDVEGM